MKAIIIGGGIGGLSEPLVKGDELAPAESEEKLAKRFRLLGTQGLVGIVLAAIDMALGDALARVQNLPLHRWLGGLAKPIRAYGAVGYDGVEATKGTPAATAAPELASGGAR